MTFVFPSVEIQARTNHSERISLVLNHVNCLAKVLSHIICVGSSDSIGVAVPGQDVAIPRHIAPAREMATFVMQLKGQVHKIKYLGLDLFPISEECFIGKKNLSIYGV